MKRAQRMLALFAAPALMLAFALGAGGAMAQYPVKSIKFIVPYTPGGSNDILARIVGERLSERLGQPVVIENKAGAESMIGTDYVAKAAPDGYTFLIGSLAMAMNPGLYDKRLPYDPVKDFIPITLFASDPLVFAVNPSVAAHSLKDLIALAKAKPGQIFYSSGAPAMRVAAEWFKKVAGVDIVHVPYKGSGPSVMAAVSGEVPLVVVSIAPALSQLRAGKIRALGVTGLKRDPVLPDIPTALESGLEFEGGIWVGLFAPAGTPRPIIDKVYGELAVVLKSDSVKGRFTTLGYDTTGMGMTPVEFASFYQANITKWTKVIKDVGIHGE